MNRRIAVSAAVCYLFTFTVCAQSDQEAARTDQNHDQPKGCQLGRYLGEENGLPIYLKTGIEWRVSPGFAEDHCFPASKIEKNMKGILAIGYKPNANFGYPGRIQV